MNSPRNQSTSSPSAKNSKATRFHRLLGLALLVLFSGCSGLPLTDLGPEARDTFLRGFHEVNFTTSTERAKQLLGPALQFPISYSKERVTGMRSSRETLNSLYWMKSAPNEFDSGKIFIMGIVVVDPNYVRTHAAIVPDELKCKDSDESKIDFAKAYLAKWDKTASVAPKTQFNVQQSGLMVANSSKPIGSGLVKVRYLKPWNQERLNNSEYTFVFAKIPEDPNGRVMLVGWVKGISLF